jgi:hypothetical protein
MGLIAHVAAGHPIVALTGPAARPSIVPEVLPLLRSCHRRRSSVAAAHSPSRSNAARIAAPFLRYREHHQLMEDETPSADELGFAAAMLRRQHPVSIVTWFCFTRIWAAIYAFVTDLEET